MEEQDFILKMYKERIYAIGERRKVRAEMEEIFFNMPENTKKYFLTREDKSNLRDIVIDNEDSTFHRGRFLFQEQRRISKYLDEKYDELTLFRIKMKDLINADKN